MGNLRPRHSRPGFDRREDRSWLAQIENHVMTDNVFIAFVSFDLLEGLLLFVQKEHILNYKTSSACRLFDSFEDQAIVIVEFNGSPTSWLEDAIQLAERLGHEAGIVVDGFRPPVVLPVNDSLGLGVRVSSQPSLLNPINLASVYIL